MISNCGSDERGNYHGGLAGDQTGKEWRIRSWYDRPWDCVLRHPDPTIRSAIASDAKDAAENDCIGYDQYDRLSFWKYLQMVNFVVKDIKNKCEADCSSGVCAIVKAIGFKKNVLELKEISERLVTWEMREAFQKHGFLVLTDKKYLSSQEYLLPGDILLNDKKHVCINLDQGSKAKAETTKSAAEAFVTRLYLLVLGRAPDKGGLNAWIDVLVSGRERGSEIAHGFFFSEEYLKKKVTDEEYVDTLYHTMLNRTPDSAGFQAWLGALKREDRERVFLGFANSSEFIKLCNQSGIIP